MIRPSYKAPRFTPARTSPDVGPTQQTHIQLLFNANVYTRALSYKRSTSVNDVYAARKMLTA